jgi:hypothetical protein
MDSQQLVLDQVFLLFTSFRRWPTWDELDRELYATRQVPDPWAALQTVDRSLIWGLGEDEAREPDDDRIIGLSLRGLSRLPAARDDLMLLLDSVRLAARWALENPRADVIITPAALERHLSLPAAGRADLLIRQRSVWGTVNDLWSSLTGTPGEPDWSVVVKPKALRPYENIAAANDLISLSPGAPGPTGAAAVRSGEVQEALRTEQLVADSGAVYSWLPDHLLGHGGNGYVYAGVGPSGEPVAVKRCALRGFDAQKWYRDARFAEREQVVAEYLRGRNLVHVLPLLDYSLTEDALFLVYPRAEFSLGSVVRLIAGQADLERAQDAAAAEIFGESGPNSEDLLAVVVDLTRGLSELHDSEVVHRDVKPDNALLHEGRWQWSDLGSSRLLDTLTSTYTLNDQGTVAYQAPEVSAGAPATEKSDVYSLGCAVFALATGEPPFGAGPEAAAGHRNEQPDLARVKEPRLITVLRWMLAKEPGARPSADWVLNMLTESEDDDPLAEDWAALGAEAIARESAAAAALRKVMARRTAGENAEAQLLQVWSQLVSKVQRMFPGAEETRDHGVLMLVMGDRRLVVKFAEPADGTSTGVRLGTVIVEAAGAEPKVEVANLAAIAQEDGEPEWRVFRMLRNDLAPPNRKMRVTESYADQYGAVSLQDLERHLVESGQAGPGAKSATRAVEIQLSAAALEQLLVAELRAINTHSARGSSS